MKKLIVLAALAGLGYFGWQKFQDWQREAVVEGLAAEARAKSQQDAFQQSVDDVGRAMHDKYGR